MAVDFKEIHIGALIKQSVAENGVEVPRICNFFKCSEDDLDRMYNSKSLDANLLLRWSKLLEYDFFRVYSQHLILFSPSSAKKPNGGSPSALPVFRKNIYTKEIIDFVLDLIKNNEKTAVQVMSDYRIPKTTLYKWMKKYNM